MHALYAGSFDPPTRGHLDLIERASKLFGSVSVAVGHNPGKRYWFTREQRRELLASELSHLTNVRIIDFDGLLVDTATTIGADVLLRGLRAPSDFDLEFRNGLANRDLAGIETLFLLSDPSLVFVSSSLVKEIFSNGGDVTRYVSTGVMEALRARG